MASNHGAQTKLACFPAWVDIPGTCGFDLGPVRIRLLPIVREKNAGKGAKINKDYIHNLIILCHTVAHSSLKTDSKNQIDSHGKSMSSKKE